MRKIPMRRCLATNQSFPKKELLRVVKTPQNEIILDLTGKANGKGAYISRNKEALDIVLKRNVLGRALECEIPQEIYQQIAKVIDDK